MMSLKLRALDAPDSSAFHSRPCTFAVRLFWHGWRLRWRWFDQHMRAGRFLLVKLSIRNLVNKHVEQTNLPSPSLPDPKRSLRILLFTHEPQP